VLDQEVAFELVGHLDQLGGGPQMEAQFIDDRQFLGYFHWIPL
jgi:hypothetical protein